MRVRVKVIGKSEGVGVDVVKGEGSGEGKKVL